MFSLRLLNVPILVVLWLTASSAAAYQGITLATGVMAMTNSTEQGGQGAAGSTILTQTDLSYHDIWWGAGLFFQYDKQGSAETDLGAGPRLELAFDPFYMELGYLAMLNRSFTDRSIAEQEGKGWLLGVGTRFALGAGGTFLQFSYKYRSQLVTEQDGEPLDEPITQTDGYPLFGIGLGF